MSTLNKITTEPLNQKSEYNIKEHLIYGHQKKWKKIIEWIVTTIQWLILLSYIAYLIYGGLAICFNWYLPEFKIYTKSMVLEIGHYFYILCVAILIVILLLFFWKRYNKRRFGRLHRRKFRNPVSQQEIKDNFNLLPEILDKMQNSRVIVLEHNIIPEDMGIGRQQKVKIKKNNDETE